MLYFDILHFKAVNDIFGKSEGDKLLSYIANYILKCGATPICSISDVKYVLLQKDYKRV